MDGRGSESYIVVIPQNPTHSKMSWFSLYSSQSPYANYVPATPYSPATTVSAQTSSYVGAPLISVATIPTATVSSSVFHPVLTPVLGSYYTYPATYGTSLPFLGVTVPTTGTVTLTGTRAAVFRTLTSACSTTQLTLRCIYDKAYFGTASPLSSTTVDSTVLYVQDTGYSIGITVSSNTQPGFVINWLLAALDDYARRSPASVLGSTNLGLGFYSPYYPYGVSQNVYLRTGSIRVTGCGTLMNPFIAIGGTLQSATANPLEIDVSFPVSVSGITGIRATHGTVSAVTSTGFHISVPIYVGCQNMTIQWAAY